MNDSVHLNEEKSITYDKLILALGSAPNKFGWPGQDLEGVSGLYSYDDLKYIEDCSTNLNKAVIVGGGLIGIELAEMFHSRQIPVTMLVREEAYWDMVLPPEESEMVGRQIEKNNIDLQLSCELKEILGDDQGHVTGVITNKGERIQCQFVGLTAGVHPNVKWLHQKDLKIGKGIIVNSLLETSVKNVYAIGDCAELDQPEEGRRPIEAVWYTGRMMGETVGHNVCGGSVKYDPGIWFNSAKFFDLEYQVYGTVLANPPESQTSLLWQNKQKDQSIRIVFIKESETVIGFNLMGVRFRQEICEQWIKERASIQTVLEQLPLASFDPEFYKMHLPLLVDQYNSLMGKSVRIGHKRRYNQVFSFLKKQQV